MKRKKGSGTQILAAGVLAALLPTRLGVPAQQAAQRETATQEESTSAAQPAPVQPLPFSHKKHLSLKLNCQFCHTNPEPGDKMGFPATVECLACHETVANDKPAIQKLAKFAQSNQPIPWVRVYAVSAFVYWSHRTHLEAGMKCEMCHGQVAHIDVMSKVTNVTTMDGCVACHQKHNAATGCETCHAGQGT